MKRHPQKAQTGMGRTTRRQFLGKAAAASSGGSNPDGTDQPARSLDLSLAEDFFDTEELPATEARPPDFDASELFDRQDDDTMKVTLVPELEPSDRPDELPRMTGGSVTVEKKTK